MTIPSIDRHNCYYLTLLSPTICVINVIPSKQCASSKTKVLVLRVVQAGTALACVVVPRYSCRVTKQVLR